MRRFQYEIFADYHQFYLQDDDRSFGDLSEAWSEEATDRLLAVAPHVIFGAKTVHVNGSYVTGVGGFLLSLVYGPLFTVFSACSAGRPLILPFGSLDASGHIGSCMWPHVEKSLTSR